MGEITFEDPPPVGNRGAYLPLLKAARDRPGEWASMDVGRYAGQAAANVKRGMTAGAEAGEFEARSRAGRLYVRFVGKPNLKAASQ